MLGSSRSWSAHPLDYVDFVLWRASNLSLNPQPLGPTADVQTRCGGECSRRRSRGTGAANAGRRAAVQLAGKQGEEPGNDAPGQPRCDRAAAGNSSHLRSGGRPSPRLWSVSGGRGWLAGSLPLFVCLFVCLGLFARLFGLVCVCLSGCLFGFVCACLGLFVFVCLFVCLGLFAFVWACLCFCASGVFVCLFGSVGLGLSAFDWN